MQGINTCISFANILPQDYGEEVSGGYQTWLTHVRWYLRSWGEIPRRVWDKPDPVGAGDAAVEGDSTLAPSGCMFFSTYPAVRIIPALCCLLKESVSWGRMS